MRSLFTEYMIRSRLLLASNTNKGFILIHVLIFYMLFTSYITGIILQKNLSLRQFAFYEMANTRVQTEKEVVNIIKNHDTNRDFEEFLLYDQQITITYDDMIRVRICGEICYSMIIEMDVSVNRILGITYE
jgi:hypothetical protein